MLTIMIGCISLSLSGLLTLYFYRSKLPIGRALFWMLLAETTAILVTVIFSVGANGPMDCIGEVSAMTLRWILFGFATLTSLHLAWHCRIIELKAIKEIERNKKKENEY